MEYSIILTPRKKWEVLSNHIKQTLCFYRTSFPFIQYPYAQKAFCTTHLQEPDFFRIYFSRFGTKLFYLGIVRDSEDLISYTWNWISFHQMSHIHSLPPSEPDRMTSHIGFTTGVVGDCMAPSYAMPSEIEYFLQFVKKIGMDMLQWPRIFISLCTLMQTLSILKSMESQDID